MKKKLLTLAVAAALPMATQAANAEVTIYGKIHASIDYEKADQSTVSFIPNGGSNSSLWEVNSRASRLGFKGSEDVGNGMKVIWKIESGVNVAQGGGGLATRNAYIGLAGNWGTFLYGRHDTPAKISTGKLDIFVDTVADYNLGAGPLNQNAAGGIIDIRANDAIAYVSPNFSGLTLIGAIVPDGNYGEVAGEVGDFAGAYSLAAMYSNGGLFLAAAYENLDNLNGTMNSTFTGTTTPDVAHWRIGAGYDFDNFHIGGVYQQADAPLANLNQDPTDTGTNDFKTYTINGSYKFGNNVVKAMWLRTDFDHRVQVYQEPTKPAKYDDSFDTWAIGLDHNFSKRSKVYVIYASSDAALNGSNYNRAAAGQAREQDVFSLGMVHNF